MIDEEIDLTYEGIATLRQVVFNADSQLLEEIDLTYEGIATKKLSSIASGGVLSSKKLT